MQLSTNTLGILSFAGVLILQVQGVAQTELTLMKLSTSEAGVYLSNDEPVAAIQFTVNSTGPVLVSVQPGLRLGDHGWVLSSHRINESLINVVLLRSSQESLPAGSGRIAGISISGGSSGRISLSRVVVASPDARPIAAAVLDLDWYDVPVTLGQNYPNPFNPETTIPYTLEEETTVTLAVYDLAGREVNRILHDRQTAGSYTGFWNGTDQSGLRVPSAVYFVRLQAGDRTLTKKMILTR